MRQQFKALRLTIKKSTQQSAAHNIIKLFKQSEYFLRAQYIGCYYPNLNINELDTRLLINTLLNYKKQLYLPIVTKNINFNILTVHPVMQWGRYYFNNKLIKNRFNILEPNLIPDLQLIPTWALDVIFLPLIAFDQRGNRLGSGCGYYDRLLSNLKFWGKKPILIGIAYAEQQSKINLQPQPWDIALDYVITPNNIFKF